MLTEELRPSASGTSGFPLRVVSWAQAAIETAYRDGRVFSYGLVFPVRLCLPHSYRLSTTRSGTSLKNAESIAQSNPTRPSPNRAAPAIQHTVRLRFFRVIQHLRCLRWWLSQSMSHDATGKLPAAKYAAVRLCRWSITPPWSRAIRTFLRHNAQLAPAERRASVSFCVQRAKRKLHPLVGPFLRPKGR